MLKIWFFTLKEWTDQKWLFAFNHKSKIKLSDLYQFMEKDFDLVYENIKVG